MSECLVDLMRKVDLAWNARDWDGYQKLISEDFQGWMNGDVVPHDRDEHIRRGKQFCEQYPDNRIEIDPYIQIFQDADGERTCSIAVTTGHSNNGVMFNAMLAVVCKWRNKQIVEQREFIVTEPFR